MTDLPFPIDAPLFRRALLGFSVTATLALGGCSPGDPAQDGPAGASNGAAGAADGANANGETPTVAELADRLVEAMGGRIELMAVQSLVLRGEGERTRMGQIPETGGEDPTGRLVGVTETIDRENGRAAFEYGIQSGPFTQNRIEVYTSFEGEPVNWNTGPGRPNIVTSPNGTFSWATQNAPQTLLRRNVVSIALAADGNAADVPAEMRDFNGEPSLYGTAQLITGEDIGLYFDPETSLLNGFTALDTETMLGDVDAEYILEDWREVGDIVLPHSVTIRKQGRPYSSIEYSSITVNDDSALAIFEIPEDAVEQAREVVAAEEAWAPLELNEVAPGIYHAVGYSHHSMVVEFPSFVAVVEGAYTEAQSERLISEIIRLLNKPIEYVVPSHPHYDHAGGVRRLVAAGATAVIAEGHEDELRAIIEAPHSNPPDSLSMRRMAGEPVGDIEVFSGAHTIEDGDMRLELYEVDTIPHVKPMVLAYAPGPNALFQSDLFFGGPGPDASALYEAIQTLDLDVDLIVGGHSGPWPFSALEEAVTNAQ